MTRPAKPPPRKHAPEKRAKLAAKRQAEPRSVRRTKPSGGEPNASLRRAAVETPGSRELVDQAHRRLGDLYEMTKLFARFENVHLTFDPALALAARTLSLRSAMLVEVDKDSSSTTIWSSRDHEPARLNAAKAHVYAACTYLVGGETTDYLDLTEHVGLTVLPGQGPATGNVENPFIVMPLVVAHRAPFGVLQVEGAHAFDKADLMFVNAIANQLSIALDRDRAWQRDITRRQRAEADTANAEARGIMSERGRSLAESARDKFETLAADNVKLYQDAQKAVRLREQVLSIVSHDLKNPLAAILLTAGTLTKASPPVERRRGLPQALGIIQRSANRMLRLIDDLLDFASIEAGHLAVTRKPQDAGALLQETFTTFESAAQAKHLHLTAEIEPSLPQVSCDRDRILQVLSNLLANATKVTADSGHITLRVEAQGDSVVFSVADDGPGISEEDVKHLFERYWRSDEVRYSGTGLGLSIARGIIGAHGGRIWVESALGRGAKFVFTIPLVADPPEVRILEGTGRPDLRSN